MAADYKATVETTGSFIQTAELVMERSLGQAALWDEVKDRLNEPGGGLSGGQQQHLCIARSLAVVADTLPANAQSALSWLAICGSQR